MGRNMKVLLLLFFLVQQGYTQIRINPQGGISLLSIENANYRDVNTLVEGSFSAEIGVMSGIDFRIGKQIYFQPGVFYSKSVSLANIKETVFAPNDSVLSVSYYSDKLLRSTIRLKALMGFNPINKKLFKLRFIAGPTYDVLVGAANEGTEINIDTRNFESGSFNIDAALGLDIYIFTIEAGVTQGLTEAFDKSKFYGFDSKYSGYYITVGILLGKTKSEKKDDDKKEKDD
jgi:Outer membrane protein beta-barrel domain